MILICFYFICRISSVHCPGCIECEECHDCPKCPKCAACPDFHSCPECDVCPDRGACYECEKCTQCQNTVLMHSIKRSKDNTNSIIPFMKKVKINIEETKLGVCCKCDDDEMSRADDIISKDYLAEEYERNQILISQLLEKLKKMKLNK